jgi:hypothetical protein
MAQYLQKKELYLFIYLASEI